MGLSTRIVLSGARSSRPISEQKRTLVARYISFMGTGVGDLSAGKKSNGFAPVCMGRHCN